MSTGVTVAVTLGSVAVLAALAGGGYYIFRRTQNQPGPGPAAPPAALPAPAPGAGTTVKPDATAADVMKLLQQKQAAEAERMRREEIRGFIDRIAATENLQIRTLAEIDAIARNTAPLEKFRQEFMNDGFQTRFHGMVHACRNAVYHNCGGRGFMGLGRCPDDNFPGCEARHRVDNRLFRGGWNGGTDRNPYAVLAEEAGPHAEKRLAQWQADQRRPLEARLVQLEIQYRGMVKELYRRFGVTYTPQDANAHAGHQRASELLATGNFSAVQPLPVVPVA